MNASSSKLFASAREFGKDSLEVKLEVELFLHSGDCTNSNNNNNNNDNVLEIWSTFKNTPGCCTP